MLRILVLFPNPDSCSPHFPILPTTPVTASTTASTATTTARAKAYSICHVRGSEHSAGACTAGQMWVAVVGFWLLSCVPRQIAPGERPFLAPGSQAVMRQQQDLSQEDSDIVADSCSGEAADVVEAARPRPRRRPRPDGNGAFVDGPVALMAVLSHSEGQWSSAFRGCEGRRFVQRHHAGPDPNDPPADGNSYVVGLALIKAWTFSTATTFLDAGAKLMSDSLTRGIRSHVLGWILHPVLCVASAVTPTAFSQAPSADGHLPWAGRDHLHRTLQSMTFFADNIQQTFADLLQTWSGSFSFNVRSLPANLVAASFCPAAAKLLLKAALQIAHMVAVVARTRASKLLRIGWPPRRALTRFARLRAGNRIGPPAFPEGFIAPALLRERFAVGPRGAVKLAHDPIDGVRFLEASMYVKDVRQCKIAWKKALQALYPDRHEELQQALERVPCRPYLLTARVRLDATVMSLRRLEWQSQLLSKDKIVRYMGADVSPQGGVEIFGGGYDTIINGNAAQVQRTEFSLTCLGHGHASTASKAMALLWQVWLVAGPSEASLRAFLGTVRFWLSDWGTESAIADVPDYVPAFMHMLEGRDANLTPEPVAGSWLFPNCLFLPGFNHVCDNLIKDAMHRLTWFPSFLRCLRAVCRLCSRPHYKDSMANYFRLNGLHAEADSIQQFKAAFAHWRWQTLYD